MVKGETYLQRFGLACDTFAVHWNALRSFLNNSAKTLGLRTSLTLNNWTDCSTMADSLLRFSLAELNSGRAHSNVLREMLDELRLSGDVRSNIMRLQKDAELATRLSCHCHEKPLSKALGLTPSASLTHSELESLICETTQLLQLEQQQLDPSMLRRIDTLCSSKVIMKWIDQQRLAMQNMAQQGVLQSPVLLGLNYCSHLAANDTRIVLLDESIHVQPGGIYLSRQHNRLARHVNNSVMVSAMRAAALLELPINMSMVLPLSNEHDALPSLPGAPELRIVLNVRYKPRTLCDIESFGTCATIALAFNVQFPIWRHFNMPRDATSGLLEPLWLTVPQQSQQFDLQQLQLHADHNVAHADCSDAELGQLLQLAAHKIKSHLLWYNRYTQPCYSSRSLPLPGGTLADKRIQCRPENVTL